MAFEHIEHNIALALGHALRLALFAVSCADFFKKITHDGYPLVGFFVIANFLSEQRIVHILGACAEKIMHEFAERRVIGVRGIDVKDVDAVVEQALSVFSDTSFHRDDERIGFRDVSFRDEDDVLLGKVFRIFAGQQDVRVHEGAVVADALR